MTELMGCRPEECVYLGDTGVDMETATRAHMYPVGVLWGFREKEELEANGAKETITHPRQVLDLLV